MSWIRIDDRFFHHRKILDLSKDAKLLFLAGLCHCGEQMTDGFISAGAARVVAATVGAKSSATKELVDCGLWHKRADGFDVHDYLEYQTSAAEIREKRQETADRVKKWREKKGRNASRNALHEPLPTPEVTQGVTQFVHPLSETQVQKVSIQSSNNVQQSRDDGGGSDDISDDELGVVGRRLAEHLTGSDARRRGAAVCVLRWSRTWVDDVVVDEAIGRCLAEWETGGRPRHPDRYVMRAIENAGREHGLTPPPTPLAGGGSR